MSVPTPPMGDDSETEAVAKQRYGLLNLARVGAIAVTIAGIAATRDLLPLPYALSVVMVVAGILAFFFAPPLLVKRWKAQDRAGHQDQGDGE